MGQNPHVKHYTRMTFHPDDVWYWKSANHFLSPELLLLPLSGQYWFPWAALLEFACLCVESLSQHNTCTETNLPMGQKRSHFVFLQRPFGFASVGDEKPLLKKIPSQTQGAELHCWTHTALGFIHSLSSQRSTWSSGWHVLWLEDIWVNRTVAILYVY